MNARYIRKHYPRAKERANHLNSGVNSSRNLCSGSIDLSKEYSFRSLRNLNQDFKEPDKDSKHPTINTTSQADIMNDLEHYMSN